MNLGGGGHEAADVMNGGGAMTCELEIVPVVVIRLAADLTATSFCDCGSLRCLLAVQHRAAAREASSGSRSRPAARCGG
jgi:hypothetical protein